ncbi:unnamed protein product, partial [Amoebophrya sp. A120]
PDGGDDGDDDSPRKTTSDDDEDSDDEDVEEMTPKSTYNPRQHQGQKAGEGEPVPGDNWEEICAWKKLNNPKTMYIDQFRDGIDRDTNREIATFIAFCTFSSAFSSTFALLGGGNGSRGVRGARSHDLMAQMMMMQQAVVGGGGPLGDYNDAPLGELLFGGYGGQGSYMLNDVDDQEDDTVSLVSCPQARIGLANTDRDMRLMRNGNSNSNFFANNHDGD